MGSEAFELSEESNDLKESGEQQEVQHYPKFIRQYEHLLMLIELIIRLQSFQDKDEDPPSSHRI